MVSVRRGRQTQIRPAATVFPGALLKDTIVLIVSLWNRLHGSRVGEY